MILCASRISLTLLGCSMLAVGAASGFLLWPALEASDARHTECGRLLSQIERADDIAVERDRVRTELESVRASAHRVLRTIPSVPEQAHLMRMLAVGAGPDMGTQTIVAGEPLPASPSGNARLRAIPVTVEMIASFECVMEVLARAESDRRLVRPIHIKIQRPVAPLGAREEHFAPGGGTLVEARLELDAVFDGAMAAEAEQQP